MSSSALNSMVVGWEPGSIGPSGLSKSIQRETLPVARSSSATVDPFQRLHQALVPTLFATTVYGNALGTNRLRLRSNDFCICPELTSRSTTLSERLLATRRRSPSGVGNTAKPAGYGGAVPTGVLRTPNATSFPSASRCGGILMKRSGVTCPTANLYTAIPLPVLFGFSPLGSVIEPIDA